MKRLAIVHALTLIAALTAVSCRQLFTTSFGAAFARDSISISSSTPTDDLIDMAASGDAQDPDAAKAVLDALGGKSTSDIQDLSVDDKTVILDLATTAALDIASVTDLISQAQDAENSDDLISDIIDSFDTTVNLDAVVAVLSDPEALASAPVDSIVMASAIVLADVAADIGTDAIMDVMAANAAYIDDPDNNPVPDLSAYTPAQQAELQTVLDVAAALEERPDIDDATIGGFNLADLLNGTQG